MSDDKNEAKLGGVKLTTKDAIYGVILVIGCSLLMSGLNGALNWGVADAVITGIGATLGVVATFVLAWLRSR